MPATIVWNRSPLPQNRLAPLPPVAIRPEGWLRQRIEASTPLDAHEGLLRACLLQDDALLAEANAACALLLDSECAPSRHDLRALMAYHAVAADKRVPLFLLRHVKALRDRMVDGWRMPVQEANNIGDLLHAVLWLYNLTGQKGLLAVCQMLKAQAPDWMSTFHTFSQTRAVTEIPDRATDAYWRVHGPTLAASLKTPALQALFEGGFKNETAFEAGWEKLSRFHGAAHGLFNAQPLLAGANPSCYAMGEEADELMHTLSVLLWAQGLAKTGDLLERIAFAYGMANADRQSANQLIPQEAYRASGMATYAASLWMATKENGLAALGYAPCQVRWRIGTQPVRIEVDTNYPYEHTIRMHIQVREPTRFPLLLRIPAWATEPALQVNGESQALTVADGYCTLERTWADDALVLTLPGQIDLAKGYHQSVSIHHGPLVYALPLQPNALWQVALAPEPTFETGVEMGIPVLYTRAIPIQAAWPAQGDVPAPPPIAPTADQAAGLRITLVPYGETRARIAQFPLIKRTIPEEEPQ